MATSGKGTATVGYNVQIAVDAEHHLIVAHEVTNQGYVYWLRLELTVVAGGLILRKLSSILKQPSVSPLREGARQERSASGSCRSTSGPDAAVARCSRPATHPDRSAVPRSCDRSFCGTPPGRTRRATCDGSARRCRWSAGSWPWCGCDRCPRPPGRARTRGFPERRTRCRDRSAPGTAGCRAHHKTAPPGR